MNVYRVEFLVGDPHDSELESVLEKVYPSVPWDWRVQDFTVTKVEDDE